MAKAPAFISHTVLVHAGSYKDFLSKLSSKYPKLAIKFVKKVSIHYYVIQLEDHSEGPGIKKQEIYSLPIMGLREEFSSFIFFKTTKGYNNVLKRMCNAPENEMAAYDLLQHMLTPFEKGVLLNLDKIKSLQYIEEVQPGNSYTVTLYDNDKINTIQTLGKIFDKQKFVVDNKPVDLTQLIKDKFKWTVGIH